VKTEKKVYKKTTPVKEEPKKKKKVSAGC